MKRKILVEPRYRQFNQTPQATLTLSDLVNTVIDEAGEDDALLVNAIIADLMESGKIK